MESGKVHSDRRRPAIRHLGKRTVQTRLPFLAGNNGGTYSQGDDPEEWGYDCEYGLGGDACIHNMARYIAVAPHDVSTSLRNLDFEA